MPISSSKYTTNTRRVRQVQLEKFTKDNTENQFEDNSIPQSKVDLSELENQIEEKLSQKKYVFDASMSFLTIPYENSKRPYVQIYCYKNNDKTQTFRSECSISDNTDNMLIISWKKGYEGYILVNNF